MSLDPSTFETLTPSQFTTFTLPNPLTHPSHLHTPLLRIAVLDSPTPPSTLRTVAAMIVPAHRETDWNFSTEHGHLQLLFNFANISRLILIGNNIDPHPIPSDYVRPVTNVTDSTEIELMESELKPIVIALHPKSCFRNGLPETVFVTYDDDVMVRVIVDRFVGPVVGEFVVEDVELESREVRRRLRFKRMPNLIQSQVGLVVPVSSSKELGLIGLKRLKEVELGKLVQPYLTPMVSGLVLIGLSINERIRLGFRPRALCLGVGGGALLSFLNEKLGFDVVGVEADEVVLNAARQYFGLSDGKGVRVIVGDAIELIDSRVKVDGLDVKFDVVMVDLDSSEARSGVSAPPLELVRRSVFEGMRSRLHDHGVVVINVIPPDELFYGKLVRELKGVFHKVYAIDVKNDGNVVVMAMVSQIVSGDDDCDFLKRLRAVVSGSYMEDIVEL